MRQIGTLPTEADAKRFAAFLLTQKVAAHAEQEPEGWAIWVRDENQVDQARADIDHFREQPHDARYDGAEQKADALLREEVKRHEQVRKNVVQMSDKWGRSGAPGQHKPLTMIVIIACVAVAMMSNFGTTDSKVKGALLFCDPIHLKDPTWLARADSIDARLVDIKQGEVWRVITPNLFHYGTMHLVFNMIMFFQLGGRVENNRGTWRFAIMIFLFGLASVVAQSLVPAAWGGSPFGAGLSGVVYGLFGYMWMKTLFDPSPDLYLSQFIVILLMGWFFLGVFGVLDKLVGGSIANWAHGGGLLMGIVIGFAPVMIKSLKRR